MGIRKRRAEGQGHQSCRRTWDLANRLSKAELESGPGSGLYHGVEGTNPRGKGKTGKKSEMRGEKSREGEGQGQ